MIEFKSYYSGSSGNVSSVFDGKTMLMLDCGVPWRRIQKAFDYRTSKISALLLTHEHFDHSKAIKEVAKSGIDIFLSKGTMEALGVKSHRYHIIESKKQFAIGSLKILPFDIIHDSPEPLGYLIASSKEKLLFCTDTLYIKYRFRNLTHIAISPNYDTEILKNNVALGKINIELAKRLCRSHMSLDTAKEFFRVNDMSQVKEIHLLHLSDKNSDESYFRRIVEEITGRPVYSETEQFPGES